MPLKSNLYIFRPELRILMECLRCRLCSYPAIHLIDSKTACQKNATIIALSSYVPANRAPGVFSTPGAHCMIQGRIVNRYSFTAPETMPLIRYFARNRYRITMGTAIKMEPAAKRENSVSPRLIRPTATVQVSFVFSRSLGRM